VLVEEGAEYCRWASTLRAGSTEPTIAVNTGPDEAPYNSPPPGPVRAVVLAAQSTVLRGSVLPAPAPDDHPRRPEGGDPVMTRVEGGRLLCVDCLAMAQPQVPLGHRPPIFTEQDLSRVFSIVTTYADQLPGTHFDPQTQQLLTVVRSLLVKKPQLCVDRVHHVSDGGIAAGGGDPGDGTSAVALDLM
jgi:hypothetical protein